MTKINKIVLLIAVLLVFFFILGGTRLFQPLPETKKEYDYLALMSEVIALVKMEYVEEVRPEEKFPGAYSGMLSSLDKFSAYLDTPRTTMYSLYRQGTFCGSGIYGEKRYNYFYITDIEPGSSAATQGLKPGDAIKTINGENIFGKSFWEMYLALLTEKPGTIDITLLRDGGDAGIPTPIKLDTVPVESAFALKPMGENFYLLTLPRLDAPNAALLAQHLQKAAAASPGMDLIIDLRQYRGGDLESFLQITKMFFSTSVPLTLKTKTEEKTLPVGSPEAVNYRAVVIIDASTRMYGELLALLFKENGKKNVTLMGANTRGYVAEIKQFLLQDGSSILLTEGFFFLEGKNLAEKGLIPDIKIKRKDFANIINLAADILKKAHD